MATIRTAIQIQDNMSRAFQSMNTSMNVVLSSFEALRTASGDAVDTASIQLARQELARAGAAFDQVENEIRQADAAQQQLNGDIRNGTNAASGLLGKIAGIAAAYLSFRTAGGIIGLSDEMTNTTARLDMVNSQYHDMVSDINNLQASANFDLNVNASNADAASSQLSAELNGINASASIDLDVNAQNIDTANISEQLHGIPIAAEISMTGATSGVDSMNAGLQTTEQLQQKIFDSAQRSYGSYQDTADLVGKLGLNAGDAFSSTDEIVSFSELLNKQFGIAGTNAEGVKNATLQLTQALGGGVLRGQELNSIFEHAPNIIHTIADYLDVPIGKIREMAGDGQISAEVVKNAMFAAADGINERFDSMPLTFEQLWTSFKNEAVWAFRPVLQGINDIANNEKFQSMIDTTVNSLYTLSAVAMGTFDVMTTTASSMYDNWSLIGPVIGAVMMVLFGYAAALGAVKLAEMAAFTWKAINTTATLIYAAAMGVGTGATWSAVSAVWGLNAALAANPIFLVIMAIVVLIGVFYAAVAAVNHFAGTSYSATGMIAGAFMVLGTHIYNQVAFWWNIFAAFAEFIVNSGTDSTYALKRLFGNLAINFIDTALAMSDGWDGFATSFVNAVIDAVNLAIKAWNWFLDLLPEGIASSIGLKAGVEYSHRESITSDLSHLKNGISDWIGETPADYWEAPKMDIKSLGGAWDTGYNWGGNLFNNDAANIQKGNQNEDIWNQMAGVLAPLTDDREKTAANTAKMAKSMEASEEDLKYMRDMAEGKAIDRIVNTEIKVDFKSENTINSDLDLDGIIDQFAEKLEEALGVAAEGV